MKYGGSIKEFKDYTLIEGELYRRLPEEILFRCINEKEGKLKLEELHSQICGVAKEKKKTVYIGGCSAWGTTNLT